MTMVSSSHPSTKIRAWENLEVHVVKDSSFPCLIENKRVESFFLERPLRNYKVQRPPSSLKEFMLLGRGLRYQTLAGLVNGKENDLEIIASLAFSNCFVGSVTPSKSVIWGILNLAGKWALTTSVTTQLSRPTGSFSSLIATQIAYR